MYPYASHFVKMARKANREGVQYARKGNTSMAFTKFVERDVQMERARSR